MSCSVPVFACIQDVNRVTSILNDAPTSGEQDVKENTGECEVYDVSCRCLVFENVSNTFSRLAEVFR